MDNHRLSRKCTNVLWFNLAASALGIAMLAVLVGSILRFWDITTKGLTETDEAGYVLIAQTLAQPVVWLSSRIRGTSHMTLTAHMTRFMGPFGHQVGFPPESKPGFYLLLIVLGGFIGFRPYSGLILSALFGSLSLLLVWCLGKMSGERWLAVASVVVLALSPYHLLFSRIGVPQITASAFLLAAAYLGLRSYGVIGESGERRYLVLSGLSLGYAFLVHPIILVHGAAFGLAEGADFFLSHESGRRRHTLWRLKWLTAATLAPILGTEVLTWVALFIKNVMLPPTPWHETYLAGMVTKVLGDALLDRGSPELLFQVSLLNSLEGALSLALMLVGSVVCLRYFGQAFYRLIALQVWIPLVLWSVISMQVPRAFAPSLPFWSMVVGLGAVRGARWISSGIGSPQRKVVGRLAVTFLLLAMVLWRLPMLIEILGLRSGYREAVAYLQQRGAERHISTQRPISQIYAGIPSVISPLRGEPLEAVRRMAAIDGYRYFLVDVQGVGFKSVTEIRGKCQPVASISNPVFTFWPLLADLLDSKELLEKAERAPSSGKIEIFDLQACFSQAR